MKKKLWVTGTIFPQFMQSKIHSFVSDRHAKKFFLMKNILWTPSDKPCIKVEQMHTKHIKNALLLIEKFDENYELSDHFTRDEWWSIFNMELWNREEECIEPKIIRDQRIKDHAPTGTPIPNVVLLRLLTRISHDLNSLDAEEKAVENLRKRQDIEYSNAKAVLAFKKDSLEKELLRIQQGLS